MLEIVIASLGLGVFTGFLAGLFGIGGGMVIVPVLVFCSGRMIFPPG